ncbi:MAG: phage virion morphogenesis protein [Negativicutes bacterium]|nr:phage virion morphogenesis protein [Negativicutes bacterium]
MAGTSMEGDWGRFANQLEKLINFDFTGLHKNIGAAMVSSTQKRFKDEKGPDGTAWTKSIRAKTEGGQTLTDTARLKNSITYQATPEGVAEGTNLIYASTMQGKDGKDTVIQAKTKKFLRFKIGNRFSMKKSVTIPARPFLGLSPDDVEEIKNIVMTRIEETTK